MLRRLHSCAFTTLVCSSPAIGLKTLRWTSLDLQKYRSSWNFISTRPNQAFGRQGLAGGIMGPGYSSSRQIFGVFLTSCFVPAALSSVELVVRIKHYKKKNAPFISKLVRMKRCKQTDATLGKLVARIRCCKETNRQTQPSGAPNCGPKT